MSPMWLIACAAALLASAAPQAAALETSPDEAVLTSLKIATEYNKAVRPPPDNGTANTVNVFAYLNSIVALNSATQQLVLKLWLMMHWTDSRLSWLGKFNSTLDHVSTINLPANFIWQPDISFYEALEQHGQTENLARVRLSTNGVAVLSNAIAVTIKCQMQLWNFPFDTHICVARLASMLQTPYELNIRIKSTKPDDPDDKYITRSNEFCILGVNQRLNSKGSYEIPEFRVKFQRMPKFYLINLILPSILLLAISAISFRLPPECGERISFSITIVLSMCVFLQLAGNYTPTQSESVPLLTCYFSVAVLMTMANVLCNAFVLNCHYKQQGDTRVSNRVVRALFLNRFVSGKVSQQKMPAVSDSQQSVSQDLKPIDKESCHSNEWRAIVTAADKIFFIIFLCVTVIITIMSVITLTVMSRTDCLGKQEEDQTL